MDTLSEIEAKRHFGAMLDRVASGGAIMITRRGHVVAKIVPEVIESSASRMKLMEYIRVSQTEIEEREKLNSAELVRDGRRF